MKGFQFSLRMMLAAVAVVGIGAGLWVAEPSWQVGVAEALIVAWTLTSAVILTVHSRGKARAFWMGCAGQCITAACFLPQFVLKIAPFGEFPEFLGMLPYLTDALSNNFRCFLVAWAFAPVVGLLCVFTHWLFVRPAD